MIKILFKNIVLNNQIDLNCSKSIYLEIAGHSDLNSKGSDILCASVSALSQTFILTIARVLKLKQQIKKEDGFLSSQIAVNEASEEDKIKLKLLIESLLIGLLEINGEYPDKIKIEFVND